MLLLPTLQRNEYYVHHYSANNAVMIVKKESDHYAENAESESESCLRPRRNSDALVKSPLKPPCEFIKIASYIFKWRGSIVTSLLHN